MENGCKFCESGDLLLDTPEVFAEIEIFTGISNIVVTRNSDYDAKRIAINYCPKCGKNLKN